MDEMYEDMTIDELNVDEKIKVVLKKLGFKYVKQLENQNIGRIYELTSLGSKYINQLEEKLYLLGVELSDEHDENDTRNRMEKWREGMALKKSENKSCQSAEIGQNNRNSEAESNKVISNADKGERV